MSQALISLVEHYRSQVLGDRLQALMRITHLPAEAFLWPERFLTTHPGFARSLPAAKPAKVGRPRKRPEPKGPSHG